MLMFCKKNVFVYNGDLLLFLNNIARHGKYIYKRFVNKKNMTRVKRQEVLIFHSPFACETRFPLH